MAATELRFVYTGFGTAVQANEIWGLMRTDGKVARSLLRQAKAEGRWLNWTAGRATKSMLFLNNGMVIACSYSVKTMYERIRKATESNMAYDYKTEAKLLTEAGKTLKQILVDYTEDDEAASIDDGDYEEDDEEIRNEDEFQYDSE